MHARTYLGRWLVPASVIIFTIVPRVVTAAPLKFLNVDVPLEGLRNLEGGSDPTDRLKRNYPDLTALAVPHDVGSASAEVRYYDRVLADRSEGQFLAAGDALGDLGRPFIDRDLIIFRETAPLYVVQHEVLHYLIDLAERANGEGILRFRARVHEAMVRGQSNDYFELQNLRLDILRRSSFEEVAMTHVMLAHRFELGLTDDQAREELFVGAKHLVDATNEFRDLVTEVDRTAPVSDPRRGQIFSRLARVAADVDVVNHDFEVLTCDLNLR